jgi:glycyl-tRNA synthetase beta chain
MADKGDLLFEIGCEELPASFVDAALAALPKLAEHKLGELRLGFAEITALGTPRRLALLVRGLETRQSDLEEEVLGPPLNVAFKDGAPTKAAEAFARKIGCEVGALQRRENERGSYLCGVRRETGRRAVELLPAALTEVALSIPFRKAMRWGSGSLSFGRPVRWLLAVFDGEVVQLSLGDIHSGRESRGHRFLAPEPVPIASASDYVAALRRVHVIVDPAERLRVMHERLASAATRAGGVLVDDPFLERENLSLVEEPAVVVGSFEETFLTLPEVVILEVARGHQRYFGLRGADGRLLPRYLAVVNTARAPERIAEGNDRVMRARLSDARFFYQEDLKRPLASRFNDLEGIVFQARLGSVRDKVARIERLVPALGELLAIDGPTVALAVAGAHLAKCDLVSYMVGEFPELQGEMGCAYALAQGTAPEVAQVIRDHYRPKGASDAPAPGVPAALVALADRLDTLAGCFAIGQAPSGSADPYGLRRACIAVLRTLFAHDLDLPIGAAIARAREGHSAELDLDAARLASALEPFFRDRLRVLLGADMAADAVDAALAVAADRPFDARARARALVELGAETRAKLGEVFKRATNIAKEAPDERDPGALERGDEPAEQALFDAFQAVRGDLEAHARAGDYPAAFDKLASLAPALARFFEEVLVMAEDPQVRLRRLHLMRAIRDSCSALARLELLTG